MIYLNLTYLIQSIIMLFIILDPIGNAPLFYGYTKDMEEGERRRTILNSIIIAVSLLIFFAFFGEPFFRYFGITTSDFRIAGGIILFVYGLWGVFGNTEVELVKERDSLAIVPLATPLLAGPGSITTVIYIKYSWGLSTSLLAILIDGLIALLILLAGEKLFNLFGRKGSIFLIKLFSMILLAIAVGMIRQGIVENIQGNVAQLIGNPP
ncbi:MAG: MarC family protein [Fervidicoccaceae archaeon]